MCGEDTKTHAKKRISLVRVETLSRQANAEAANERILYGGDVFPVCPLQCVYVCVICSTFAATVRT